MIHLPGRVVWPVHFRRIKEIGRKPEKDDATLFADEECYKHMYNCTGYITFIYNKMIIYSLLW